MKSIWKKYVCAALTLALLLPLVQSAQAVQYMPGVSKEMADPAYWSALYENAGEPILTPEEIKAYNYDTYAASGTMVMDLRTAPEVFDGIARNKAVRTSATADAEYYYGWTYGPDGKKADWDYYQEMIDNCRCAHVSTEMPVRYGIAVYRTVLQVLPSENPIWDDPKDKDFNYQYLSAVQVNDPLLIYTTSMDGKYYLARSRDCSGWIPAKDVAICASKEQWLSAWDLPSEDLLVVYGNKVYTDQSYTAPETARRMLGQGTKLERVKDLAPDQLVNNRSPYHNYVVYLPVRRDDGGYEKRMALIPETAAVSEGYLPLTLENIAIAMLANLGDAYGWGGMMDVEDCSGQVRTVYACFGLEIGRNGNWQWKMNMEKIDMTNMSLEEKRQILDALPLGAALCFPGHEMFYLGKVEGEYYVFSTASSIMSPDTGERLRTRTAKINDLNVKRANGKTWLEALDKAFVPAYAKLEGKSYDFPTLEWYHEGVSYCIGKGLLTNRPNGDFGIGESLTRAELAKALWVMAGKPKAETPAEFTDLTAEHEAAAAIGWAAECGVLRGYEDGSFAPEATAQRQQTVTALWRFDQLGEKRAVMEEKELPAADAKNTAEYALAAFRWAYGSLVNGGDAGLCPQAEISREEAAMFLWRYAMTPKAAVEAAPTELT